MAHFGPVICCCADCGIGIEMGPWTYQVVETKCLCEGCADKRGSQVLDRDGLPFGKSLTLKCSHCSVGVCDVCEKLVKVELERLNEEERPVPAQVSGGHFLVKTKELQLPEGFLRICVVSGENRVAVLNSNGSMFILDLGDKKFAPVVTIRGSEDMCIDDCITINRTELLASNLASGCLENFNCAGKWLGSMSVPRTKALKKMDLARTNSGQILAARRGESEIFILSALGEKCVGSIKLRSKSVLRDIQVTPSGRVIVQTDWAEFVVIDESSGQQATIADSNWYQATCGTHPSEDLLYVMYSRKGGDTNTIFVDEITVTGSIKRKKILTFKLTGALCRPLVTVKKELVVLNGRFITVFR